MTSLGYNRWRFDASWPWTLESGQHAVIQTSFQILLAKHRSISRVLTLVSTKTVVCFKRELYTGLWVVLMSRLFCRLLDSRLSCTFLFCGRKVSQYLSIKKQGNFTVSQFHGNQIERCLPWLMRSREVKSPLIYKIVTSVLWRNRD